VRPLAGCRPLGCACLTVRRAPIGGGRCDNLPPLTEVSAVKDAVWPVSFENGVV